VEEFAAIESATSILFRYAKTMALEFSATLPGIGITIRPMAPHGAPIIRARDRDR